MSETKAKLQNEVARLSAVCREAAALIERADEIYEDISPSELNRLLSPLREAICGRSM